MPRQTDPKEAKETTTEAPKVGASGGMGLVPMLIVALVIVLGSGISSAASVYFLAPMVMEPMLAKINVKAAAEGEGHEAEGEGHGAAKVGPVLDLDEFTVNLNDEGGERYLKADFSIMVSVKDETYTTLSGHDLEKWETDFKHHMGHYIPSIRDIIISTLTKYSAEELATVEGKNKVKKEIMAQSSPLFHGENEVLRVNIENFIIQ
jgi:flagellar FliL protein